LEKQNTDIKYTWDLKKMYTNERLWESDFESVKKMAIDFKKYKGELLCNSETLLNALKDMEMLERKLENVYVYAHLNHDKNTKVSKYQTYMSRCESLLSEVGEMTAFFAPEMMESDFQTVDLMMQNNKTLAEYRKYFEDLYRGKPYILSEEIENILAQTEEMANSASNAYGMLLNADMTFEDAIDSNGKAYKLTNGSYISLMMNNDRMLRKDAFKKYYKGYEANINTIASLLQSEVKKNIFNSKVRGFKSARESALFKNNISVDVPDALIKAVNENFEPFYDYMALRKDVLGYDELHLYDIYNTIVEDVEYDVPYEEAQETILGALSVLGTAYTDVVKDAFDHQWIDVYETEGKRSGAYSSGTYESYPYILLNYKENVDNMFTLAHEMGHSMHSYLTHKKQPYIYGNYSIFVAEVASTTNEALLNDYLMKTLKDSNKRKYILNHYLEQFRGTIYRQTMFAEFERDIHAKVEAGGALTAEYLCDHYLSLNKKYYGDHVVIDEEIKYEWARIPHMYMNFYVYQYATGFSAAIALASKILTEGEVAVKDYLTFLSSGSKDYPLEVLKKAGADMTTDQPVKNALETFSVVVKELRQLLKS